MRNTILKIKKKPANEIYEFWMKLKQNKRKKVRNFENKK